MSIWNYRSKHYNQVYKVSWHWTNENTIMKKLFFFFFSHLYIKEIHVHVKNFTMQFLWTCRPPWKKMFRCLQCHKICATYNFVSTPSTSLRPWSPTIPAWTNTSTKLMAPFPISNYNLPLIHHRNSIEERMAILAGSRVLDYPTTDPWGALTSLIARASFSPWPRTDT